FLHFGEYMLSEVNGSYPSVFIYFFKPFLVIAIIRSMKVEYIFANQNKFANSVFHHVLNHITLQHHNIIADGIIPFAHQLNDGKRFVVIAINYFQIKSRGSKVVPLRMNEIVI